MRKLLFLPFVLILVLAAGAEQVHCWNTDKHTLETALEAAPKENREREKALETSFVANGCSGAKLQHQEVKGHGSNLICEIAGSEAGVIIVGAHFDHVQRGDGIVDNWSGAVLLPLLAKSVAGIHPKHTYRFIAFTDEEKGLIGSKYYVSHLSKEEKKQILAMVNFDSLGLSPTKIWLDHGDRHLAQDIAAVAGAMKLPLSVVNVENLGSADSDPFFNEKIPALTIHSVTQDTFSILHTVDDNFSAINMDDYYDTYRLVALYLSYLDSMVDNKVAAPAAAK
jgi:Zn-dependent M28 family amino/carboxypeptidase